MTASPQPVILVIADISGYTRFMVANARTLAHAQAIITELLEAILREVDVPLRVSKLEGDAVFMYAARAGETDAVWEDAKRAIGRKLLAFFDAFSAATARLASAHVCSCAACDSVRALRLKAIVHAGEAIVHDVGGFRELAGVDVIVAHRLLKNSVEGSDYVLMTEAAYRELGPPGDMSRGPSVRATERYDDVGEVPVHVFRRAVSEETLEAPAFRRSAVGWASVLLWRSMKRLAMPDGAFRNVPSRPESGGRVGALLFFLLIAPILLLRVTLGHLRRR